MPITKYCEVCGKPFKVANWNKDQRFCSKKCAYKARTIPIPPKEELERLYFKEEKSIYDIAKIYKVSYALIVKWFKNTILKQEI